MPELSIEISDLHHDYEGRPALKGVTMDVSAGVLLAFLGPNGSGKTTLFRVLSTLLAPRSGRARVCGYDAVSEASAVRRCIGIAFQQAALDGDLTVAENLRHHAALYGMRGAPVQRRMRQVLEAVGLEHRSGDRIKTLSGGLTRRVDLARVLMHRPRVLLLDEPTTGLDPSARRAFWQALAVMRREAETTVVVATHLLEEAEQCDDIAIMSEGRLVARDSPDMLKAALGQETLWIESPDPRDLAESIYVRFGVEARVVGQMIQISHPSAHSLLAQVYEAMPDDITSATVRRPTLEDVYMLHTGHGMHDALHPLSLAGHAEADSGNRAEP